MDRRSLLTFAAALSLPFVSPVSSAKDVVRLVVPFPAGGGGDTLARSVTTALAAALKTSLWVDNRPGAGGTVGTRHVAQDKKNGSVVGYVTNGILCANFLLYPNLKFDPAKELIPVGRISEIGMVAVLNPRATAGVTDLKSLLAYAKAHPGTVNFASSGVGTSSHLAGLLFAEKAGIRLTHIPYRGGAAAMTDVLSGRIPLMIDVAPNVLGHVRAGTLKALGASTKARLAAAPEIPTLIEEGLAGFEISAWDGLVLPAGTPWSVVERVSKALQSALADPAVQQSLAKKGAEVRPGTPQDFFNFIESESPKWAALVKAVKAEESQK